MRRGRAGKEAPGVAGIPGTPRRPQPLSGAGAYRVPLPGGAGWRCPGAAPSQRRPGDGVRGGGGRRCLSGRRGRRGVPGGAARPSGAGEGAGGGKGRLLQKGALKKGGEKKVSGEFLACLETARLIAMRFRFETGSRQHLENESLQLTKKLCGFLLSGLCICSFLQFPL